MIAGWLLYCIVVSALLALGASAIDRVLTSRGRAARLVWIAAMASSFALPAAMYLQQIRRPAPALGWTEREMAGLNERFPLSGPTRVSAAIGVPRPRAPELLAATRIVVTIAIGCILIAAARVVVDSYLLYRSRHQWTAHVVDGAPVLVSDDLGPAIVGFLTPKIVLPRWTLSLPAEDLALVLAHEREHVRKHDGRVATAALIAVASMPWNPAMWYALRRLRTAIEVDCDRRVLRSFPDVRRYGRLLVDVAQRGVGSSMAIAGFSERAAPLARRIRAMSLSVRNRVSLHDVVPGLVGAFGFIGAIVVLPPEAPPRWFSDPRTDGFVVAKYVGDSIAEGESPPTVIAAARDLPAEFIIAEMGPTPTGSRRECPQRLHDARDGTRLTVSVSTGAAANAVQHGDTTWRRSRSLGFYSVSPVGRYGVGENQTLRVGCGSHTQMDVAGKPVSPDALSTLDSRDDRSRRIAAEMKTLYHVEPMAVDLFRGRLHVVIGDTTAVIPSDETPRGIGRVAFNRIIAVLGEAAMPETLQVTMRRNTNTWVTMAYYTSMDKK